MFDSIYRTMSSDSVMGLFFQVFPITCLAGVIYAIYRGIQIKRQEHPIAWGTEVAHWLFVCYLTGVINLVLVPSNLWSAIWFWVRNGYSGGQDLNLFSDSFNFLPSIIMYLRGELILGGWVKKMLVGNLLMYIPMGFFLPFISENAHGIGVLKYAISIPVIIEIIQPIVGRSFDVDDLICNFVGIIFGYLIAVPIVYLKGKKTT